MRASPARSRPRTAPGPAGLPLLGSALDWARGPLELLTRSVRRYGDVVLLPMPGAPVYLFAHPDDIERVLLTEHHKLHKDRFIQSMRDLLGNGLLTSEGDFWKRQRRMIQPAFHHQRIQGYAEVMVARTNRMLDGWRAGEARDLHHEMSRLTLAIVGKTLFGAEVEGDAETVGAALEVVVERLLGVFSTGMRPPAWVPTPLNLRYRRAVRHIDEVLYRVIAEARRRPEEQGRSDDRGDLLTMLVRAQDDEARRMSDQQLRDEVITLFLAGHETTAIAMSFTWYLLARHPAALERLGAEVDAVLGSRPARADDLPRLRFAEAVVSESMRLYPPAWITGREALEPLEIGGYDIPAGAQLEVSPWVTHRDPRWFDDPESFRPERWEGDLAKRLPRFAYFPFGGGPRICIGNAFAKMEAVLLLATMARRVRLRLAPPLDDGRPPALLPSVTLRPKDGIPVIVELRERGAQA